MKAWHIVANGKPAVCPFLSPELTTCSNGLQLAAPRPQDVANAVLPIYVLTFLFFAGFLFRFDDIPRYWCEHALLFNVICLVIHVHWLCCVEIALRCWCLRACLVVSCFSCDIQCAVLSVMSSS